MKLNGRALSYIFTYYLWIYSISEDIVWSIVTLRLDGLSKKSNLQFYTLKLAKSE